MATFDFDDDGSVANFGLDAAGAEKRTRVETACDFCIVRKIKCDAGQPCNQCSKRNRPECLYTKQRKAKGPGRRRTSKNTVQQLEAKIKVLETLVGARPLEEEATILLNGAAGLELSDPAHLPASLPGTFPFPAATSSFSASSSFSSILGIVDSGLNQPGHGAFWPPPAAVPRIANPDPATAAAFMLNATPRVHRPLSLFESDLPDSNVMNSLFRVYRDTLANLILYSPQALRYSEASPLLRLAMSAVAARYIPECASFGEELFARGRALLQPTLSGDVAPTIDVMQGLINMVMYAGVSNDEGELLWSHRMLRQLTSYAKELGLDDERKVAVTRNWSGETVQERDLNLRRALFWTVFCFEQHFVLMDTFRGAFRDSDVNVGLPWAYETEWIHSSQPPIRLTKFDSGIGELAYSPYARTIFLHHIIRRLTDVVMESHDHVLKTNDFSIPPDLVQKRTWIRDKLKEYYNAEVQYAHQEAHQFSDVLVPQSPGGEAADAEEAGSGMFTAPLVDRNGTLIDEPAGGSRVFFTKLQARNSLSGKAIVYHGLSAFVGCPREDLEAFFDITNVGIEPISKFERQQAKERLTRWINLPVVHAARKAAAGPDAPVDLLEEEAARNVLECFEHVAGLTTQLQHLMNVNPSISFVHPLTLWCIWVCGIIDLARFVLSTAMPDPALDARIPFMLQVLRHVTVKHSWPFAASFIEGFSRMFEWAMRSKANQVVATLTSQPVDDRMLDNGLRFTPCSVSSEAGGNRSTPSSGPARRSPADSVSPPPDAFDSGPTMRTIGDLQNTLSSALLVSNFDDLDAVLNS
ncbi:hypothetical protein DFJ74DRAFT_210212 [Hyaloraphidium curvatum]|nr:hypothetical protein DFJ74DRAFT_210212 [Hyaloraphidium curvatum]